LRHRHSPNQFRCNPIFFGSGSFQIKIKTMPISTKNILVVNSLCLFIIIFTLGEACKITVKLKSNTKEKFRIQIFVPSVEQKSEKVLFTGPEEKKLQVWNPKQ
jgi:hypothetical protein